MKHSLRITVAAVSLLNTSCDAYRWPPFENQLTKMFHDNVETVLAIEQEMIADGRASAGSGLARKIEQRRTDQPALTPEQLENYSQLFRKLGFYGTFIRIDDTTHIQLVSQTVRSRDFYISYVHGNLRNDLPGCEGLEPILECGECYVDIQPEWYLQYRWSDGEGVASTNGCIRPDNLPD